MALPAMPTKEMYGIEYKIEPHPVFKECISIAWADNGGIRYRFYSGDQEYPLLGQPLEFFEGEHCIGEGLDVVNGRTMTLRLFFLQYNLGRTGLKPPFDHEFGKEDLSGFGYINPKTGRIIECITNLKQIEEITRIFLGKSVLYHHLINGEAAKQIDNKKIPTSIQIS